MAVIDISDHMVPSRYGDSDQWVTADQFNLPIPATSSPYDPDRAESWIELVMYCRYTRSVQRFSVLYQGPAGEMRMVHGGPKVPGPIGSLVCQATVIAAQPVRKAKLIEVKESDVLVINGQRMVIVDSNPHQYPKLVTEVEYGVILATEVVRSELKASFRRQPGTEEQNARRNERQAVLTGLVKAIDDLRPTLRRAHV